MQQAGRNTHDHICQSLELFASEVMPEFKAEVAARETRKAAELAPFVQAALARKQWMTPLADGQVPVVKASVARALAINLAGNLEQGSRVPDVTVQPDKRVEL